MKRIITIVIAAGSLAAAAPAAAATHAGCGSLPANGVERCSAHGYFTHFQLTSTGKFTIQLPYGPLVTAHQVAYRNWQAYVSQSSSDTGYPVVRNIGCCWENYWNGYVW